MSGLPETRNMLSGKCFFVLMVLIDATTTGKTGSSCNCIPLKECSSVSLTGYLSKIKKLLYFQFLKTVQCGSEDGIEKICCPDFPKKDQPRTGMLCSNCVILKKCQYFMDMLHSTKKPLKGNVVNFLRSQECGFENGMPKVCCSPVPDAIQDIQHTRSTLSILFINNLTKTDEVTTVMSSTSKNIYTTSRPPTTEKAERKTNKSFEEFKNKFFQDILEFNEVY